MLKTVTIEEKQLSLIIDNISRSQLKYNEYDFISDFQLKSYFSTKVINAIKNYDCHSYALISGRRILGLIICNRDNFDSENFGFNCYRITDLLVFSEEYKKVNRIVKMLLTALEKKLQFISLPFYLSISLNTNTKNVDQLFNSLTTKNFYYIHTLLTFGSQKRRFETSSYYPKEKLKIRLANEKDAPQVATLAQKSFRYSRFHLDPFLDNDRASLLLKKSAENSILHGFVDVMFIAEIKKKIVGYYSGKKRYTLDFDKTIGEAVISAVDFEYRGLGVFSKLDAHLLNWFSEHTDFSEMGTYLANYPVHKTWINKGLGLIRGVHLFSKFFK